jgi:hypothetical protein
MASSAPTGFEHHQANRPVRANSERSAWAEVKWTVVMLIRRAPSTLDWDSVKIGRLDSEVRRLCFKGVSLAGGVPGAWESPAIR